MENDTISLKKIVEIPENEFRNYFSKWMFDKDMSKDIQAKLRKNLIEDFSTTRLGKTMSAKQNRNRKVIFSPLTLILNTLVAEFLYSQNCHYSLSVFCTEIPFQSTLPNFENQENFRFTDKDLLEILDAIDPKLNDDIRSIILNKYLKSDNSNQLGNCSCLYTILETIFSKASIQPKVSPTEKTKIEAETDIKCANIHNSDSRRKCTSLKINKKHRRRCQLLKSRLALFTNKIKELSLQIQKLEKSKIQPNGKRQTANFEMIQFNIKLDKISELLQTLLNSKRSKNKLRSVLAAVDEMSKQFQHYVTHFEGILKNQKEQNNKTKIEPTNPSEWITKIKETKSGDEFLSKVESCMKKLITREKHRMAHLFTKKLKQQKKLLKLKYKCRCLNKSDKISLDKATPMENVCRTSENIAEVVKDPEYNKNPIKQSSEITDIKKNEAEGVITEKNLIVVQPPQLEEMTKKIIQHERHIDNVVHEAKLRIQELQHESLQIDNSFKDYLTKQEYNQNKVRQNLDLIWQQYNLEKTALNKKSKVMHNKPVMKKFKPTAQEKFEAILNNISETNITNFEPKKKHSDQTNKIDSNFVFQNPFKELQHNNALFANFSILKKHENKPQHPLPDLNETKMQITKNFLGTIENVLQHNINERSKTNMNKKKQSTKQSIPNDLKAELKEQSKKNDELPIDVYNENVGSISTEYLEDILNDIDISSENKSSRTIKRFDLSDKTHGIEYSTRHQLKDFEISKNIFQMSSFSKDEELSKILESSTSEINQSVNSKSLSNSIKTYQKEIGNG